MLGFSFQGPVKAPYVESLGWIRASQLPVLSIDIPSGWAVDDPVQGDPSALHPESLISLTLPKYCAAGFKGKHHLQAGSFVPPSIFRQFHLDHVPSYPDGAHYINLSQGVLVRDEELYPDPDE